MSTSSVPQPGAKVYTPLVHPTEAETPANWPIRLLRLKPGKFDDDLECELRISTIGESAGKYEAISYCWGDPTLACKIWVIGPDEYLPITASVDVLIRYLRLEDADRDVWIDQVCINQLDAAEKARQVGGMGHVFGKAAGVVAWIGLETAASKRAFGTVRRLRAFAEIGRSETAITCKVRAGGIDEFFQSVPYSAWLDVSDLERRDYFNRTWTTVEISVNNNTTILCGSSQLEFATLSLVFLLFLQFDPDRYVATLTSINIAQLSDIVGYQGHPSPKTLTRILVGLRDKRATDARDKVFAALFSSKVSTRVRIDYSDSTTVRHVFTQVVEDCIEKHQLDFMLSCLWGPSKPEHGLPSWCPDWTSPSRTDLQPNSNAAAGTRLEAKIDGLVFSLKGASLGKINHLMVINHQVGWIQHLSQEVEDVSESGISDMELGRTLVTGLPGDLRKIPRSTKCKEFEPCYSAWKKEVVDGHSKALSMAAEWFNMCVLRCTHGRKLCRTDRGDLGLVRGTAQEGDELCVIFGLKSLHCLRPVGDKYEYLGQCYVDRYSNGEAIEEINQGILQARTFDLI